MRPNIGVLRSALLPMLTEHGQVWKPGTGDPVFNPNTGQYDDPPDVMVWEGPVLVRPQGRDVQIVNGGSTGLTYALTRYDVTMPAETPADRGMWLIVTDCTFEPELVGLRINLVDVPLDAWAIARFCVGEIATN